MLSLFFFPLLFRKHFQIWWPSIQQSANSIFIGRQSPSIVHFFTPCFSLAVCNSLWGPWTPSRSTCFPDCCKVVAWPRYFRGLSVYPVPRCPWSPWPPCSHLQIWWRCGLPPQQDQRYPGGDLSACTHRCSGGSGQQSHPDHNKTRPADILLSNWFLGKPAALDVSITSLLNPLTLLEAGVLAKSAAQVTEARKHQANDPKCSEFGWVCVPMVAESYGAWGDEASSIISSIASRLATSTCKSKSVVLNDIYGRLNVHLVRANATAILSRIIPLS